MTSDRLAIVNDMKPYNEYPTAVPLDLGCWRFRDSEESAYLSTADSVGMENSSGGVSGGVGRSYCGFIGSCQIFYLDERNDRQDTREGRQEQGEDSRPSFWDDPYKSIPLLLGAFYGLEILLGIYLVWQFKLWPRDENNRDNDHSRQRDGFD
jgi:hypothetical protein